MRKIIVFLFLFLGIQNIVKAQLGFDTRGYPYMGSNRFVHPVYRFNINDYNGFRWAVDKDYYHGNRVEIKFDGVQPRRLFLYSSKSKFNFQNTETGVWNKIEVASIISHVNQRNKTQYTQLTNGVKMIVVDSLFENCIEERKSRLKPTSFDKYHSLVERVNDSTVMVNRYNFIPILISAVQNLNSQVIELETRLDKYRAEFNSKRIVESIMPDNHNSTRSMLIEHFNGRLKVTYNFDKREGNYLVRIYDMKGLMLCEKNVGSGVNSLYVDIESLPKGLYFCCIIRDNKIIETCKFNKE